MFLKFLTEEGDSFRTYCIGLFYEFLTKVIFFMLTCIGCLGFAWNLSISLAQDTKRNSGTSKSIALVKFSQPGEEVGRVAVVEFVEWF
jgi:hypothetical protein